ncbi:hypothetical protein [uncultured Clostridium sp.]|uniref:hypothetical protein n=1 Tax=uncultured Clostridium sp. TaxID=59620 RepID=UPI0026EF3ADD|nr:hypothetical protein [uncultured Clostridium sp.]
MKLAEDNGDIICDIAKVKLQKSDVLVLDFGNADMTLDNLSNIGNTVHDMFPDNKIMFIGKGVELKIIDGGSEDEQRD